MKKLNNKIIEKYVHKKLPRALPPKQKEQTTSVKLDTSWSKVSSWYDELLNQDNTYQKQIIAPRLLRIMGIIKNKKILDIACGQGYFTRLVKDELGDVCGIDISSSLIKKAKELGGNIEYKIENAENISYKNETFDDVFSVLAFQNIEKVGDVFSNAYRILKKEGRLIIVINHPAFRVPKNSDWIYDKNKNSQGRFIDKYLSESKVVIDMHPGQKFNKEETISFHRPLQFYFKAGEKAGFVVIRLEEWESHKASQNGPRKLAEDKARKEIPMFMAIVFKKL